MINPNFLVLFVSIFSYKSNKKTKIWLRYIDTFVLYDPQPSVCWNYYSSIFVQMLCKYHSDVVSIIQVTVWRIQSHGIIFFIFKNLATNFLEHWTETSIQHSYKAHVTTLLYKKNSNSFNITNFHPVSELRYTHLSM